MEVQVKVINSSVLHYTMRVLNKMISNFPFSSTILCLLEGHYKPEMLGMTPPCFMSWKQGEILFKYRYPWLFESSYYATSLLWKTCIITCFPYRDCPHPDQWKWYHQAPSPGATLSVSASNRHSFEGHL